MRTKSRASTTARRRKALAAVAVTALVTAGFTAPAQAHATDHGRRVGHHRHAKTPAEVLASFVAPASLGSGYANGVTTDGIEPPEVWESMKNDSLCVPFRAAVSSLDSLSGPGQAVTYVAQTPGAANRSLKYQVVSDEVGSALMEAYRTNHTDFATCLETVFRTIIPDFTLTDIGGGDLGHIHVDGVWRKGHLTSPLFGLDTKDALVMLWKAPLLVTLAIEGDPSDETVQSITKDVAKRMRAAAHH